MPRTRDDRPGQLCRSGPADDPDHGGAYRGHLARRRPPRRTVAEHGLHYAPQSIQAPPRPPGTANHVPPAESSPWLRHRLGLSSPQVPQVHRGHVHVGEIGQALQIGGQPVQFVDGDVVLVRRGVQRALLDSVAERDRTTDEDALRRAAPELLGLKRLTENVRSCFAAVRSIRHLS